MSDIDVASSSLLDPETLFTCARLRAHPLALLDAIEASITS